MLKSHDTNILKNTSNFYVKITQRKHNEWYEQREKKKLYLWSSLSECLVVVVAAATHTIVDVALHPLSPVAIARQSGPRPLQQANCNANEENLHCKQGDSCRRVLQAGDVGMPERNTELPCEVHKPFIRTVSPLNCQHESFQHLSPRFNEDGTCPGVWACCGDPTHEVWTNE